VSTIHARVASAREDLKAAGIPSDEAELDARLLAAHVLGWTTERYLTDASVPAPPAFDDRFQALIARRAAREPFAYIVGRQEFWGLDIEVSPSVLIPRPETELIVEAACEIQPDPSVPITVADVGTGTGCVAVAIAKERPLAVILATDVSDAALDVARRNAERLNVANRITFRRADLLEGIDGSFDLVVSNPPYVRSGDRAGIQPEVQFEPDEALYGGADGLDIVRRLVRQAADRLKPAGTLIFEFGFGQGDAVTELFASAPGLKLLGLRDDLQGIQRVAIARRIESRN
jgi:release factor glutamine methyltransferase